MHDPSLRSLRASKHYALGVILFSAVVDWLVAYLTLPNLPLIVTDIMGAPLSVAGLTLASFAPAALVASPVFGLISDRMRRNGKGGHVRIPFLAASVLVGACGVCFIVAILWRNLPMLFVARFLAGFGGGGLMTMTFIMMSEYWPDKDEQAKVLGLHISVSGIGQVAGPVLGGTLYSVQPWSPFLVIVGLSVVDFVLRFVMIEAKPEVTGSAELDASNSSATIQDLTQNDSVKGMQGEMQEMRLDDSGACQEPDKGKHLWTAMIPALLPCLFITVAIAGISALQSGLPVYLANTYAADASTVGLFYLYLLAPSMITAPLSAYLTPRCGLKRVVGAGLALALAAAALLAVFTSGGAHMGSLHLFGGLIGVCSGCTYLALVPVIPLVSARAPARHRGGASGAWVSTSINVGMMVGPVVGGVLFDQIGWWAVMVDCSAFLAVSVGLLVFL
ncbi:major facilitator superfamily domain-containing protein [Chytriomyces sp. MP71]|nr:major facilitator superfamily domain-containing protein [Chytriomyces sp. MP71]